MSPDVTRFATAVRAALSDLTPEQRDDLLDDLEGHLAEVAEDGELPGRLGTPEAYAAELRVSAGLPAKVVGPRRLATGVRTKVTGWVSRVEAAPGGREAIAFLPELRPGWWVARAWLAMVLLGALTAQDGYYGMSTFPFPRVLGSAWLGLLLLAGAVVLSVRLGRRTDDFTARRRRLIVAANVAALLAGMTVAANVRDSLGSGGYGGYYEVANPASDVLNGPDGPIHNIYPYDSLGRPLRDVQLFDQEGRPLSQLLRQTTDGRYAEPDVRFGVDGQPKPNVFPRDYRVEDYDEQGRPTTAPVPPPSITPATLTPRATPSPSSSPQPAPSASPTSTATPTPSG